MSYQKIVDGAVVQLAPSLLKDSQYGNKRKSRPEKKRTELRQSIKEHGVLQNIIARPHPTQQGELEMLGGYGRRDIAIELELATVPVLVKDVNDRDAYIIHLQENTIRTDLSVVEEAEAAQEFMTVFGGDREAVSQALNWPTKKGQ